MVNLLRKVMNNEPYTINLDNEQRSHPLIEQVG
jgi:hypothetical protein